MTLTENILSPFIPNIFNASFKRCFYILKTSNKKATNGEFIGILADNFVMHSKRKKVGLSVKDLYY